MSEIRYGWHGWKMPILHPNDPEFCEFGWPICVPARPGKKFAGTVQKIEMATTFGGCWWSRARKRKYGVAPDQARPAELTRRGPRPFFFDDSSRGGEPVCPG